MKKHIGLVFLILLLAELTFASELWDSSLDTGRSANFLLDVEKDVILEVNMARTNPAAYAEEYLVPMREYFNGNLYQEPGAVIYRTNEGLDALDECIRVMKAQGSMDVLVPSKGLSRAARDHVEDTGPEGITGHIGSDRSEFGDRISRYTSWETSIGEAISYGDGSARGIVIQLLVDDGVPSRGHRELLLDEVFGYVGVAIGPHISWDYLCVIDLAVMATDKF